MNEIKINGTQKFMGIDIPIVEGGFGKIVELFLQKASQKFIICDCLM